MNGIGYSCPLKAGCSPRASLGFRSGTENGKFYIESHSQTLTVYAHCRCDRMSFVYVQRKPPVVIVHHAHALVFSAIQSSTLDVQRLAEVKKARFTLGQCNKSLKLPRRHMNCAATRRCHAQFYRRPLACAQRYRSAAVDSAGCSAKFSLKYSKLYTHSHCLQQ